MNEMSTSDKLILQCFISCYSINKSVALKGSVAQWLEQGTHKPKVVGSNPTRASC